MLAIYLQKLFFTHIKDDEKTLIRILTSILKLDTKAKQLENFYNINPKIQIYTDVNKIEIDIRNILQIV